MGTAAVKQFQCVYPNWLSVARMKSLVLNNFALFILLKIFFSSPPFFFLFFSLYTFEEQQQENFSSKLNRFILQTTQQSWGSNLSSISAFCPQPSPVTQWFVGVLSRWTTWPVCCSACTPSPLWQSWAPCMPPWWETALSVQILDRCSWNGRAISGAEHLSVLGSLVLWATCCFG